MTARRFVQLDVFADRPGAGNPLAVVFDAGGLDDATMQAIARWTRLPETTFVFAPDAGSDYRIRMFSPRREVPFAGHPSVGTAQALLAAGRIAPDADGLVWQDGIAGRLPLRVTGTGNERTVAVRTPKARVVETAERDDPRLRSALDGLPPGALPPALVDGGRRWWLAELADERSLREAQPDWNAIGRLAESTATMGLCAYARADAGNPWDLVVRAWVGAPAQFEDAASGAANATLAAWLASRDALPGGKRHYVVSQGREVGYDARLQLQIDDEGEVWSGGRVAFVIEGTLDWAG
ncbi:PhzF family phenazine biosynthesis protein [Luteimonas sp. MHLX1A]|uniref:PhzF family phenazine biosynthesis protein n=1 Tax=Alterluteimonas muca TaxID=2878684 RepID=UPI001E52D6F6|nr:PhzF family phenazine biosynthesis protein [Luteimonas sp. MHLX1A]MCD9046441.1 PhzF family phenazine biosynthesis protein [Luteimonas sp. MHLX1A]